MSERRESTEMDRVVRGSLIVTFIAFMLGLMVGLAIGGYSSCS